MKRLNVHNYLNNRLGSETEDHAHFASPFNILNHFKKEAFKPSTSMRMDMKSQNLPELDYFSDLIGEFIQYWGFKKIHGKIWINLYFSQHPMDAAEIMQRLKISKALASISIRDLLEYKVIEEQGLSDTGTRLYVANPDLSDVIALVLRQREKVMMGKIQAAFIQLKKLPKDEIQNHDIPMERIKDLDKFIRKGDKALDTLMAFI